VANQANVGSFIPGDINFNVNASVQAQLYDAQWATPGSAYWRPFPALAFDRWMFKLGDASAYCVFYAGELPGPLNFDLDALNAFVVDSFNQPVATNGYTNVLWRSTADIEDPWVGCAGTHIDNTNFMLVGRDGMRRRRVG
jgi:hypothetical protein